jgi:hypothetical protein
MHNMWANVIVLEGGADEIDQHVVLDHGGSQQPQGVAKVGYQWRLPLIFGLAVGLSWGVRDLDARLQTTCWM